MADFDPTQFGATAVEDTQQPFDPTAHGAIPVQEEEKSRGFGDVVKDLGSAALNTVQQITGLHRPTSLKEIVQEIYPTEFKNTLVGGMLANTGNLVKQYTEAVQKPAFSKEGIEFGANVVGQAGGQLLGLLGLKGAGEVPTTLGEVVRGKAEPATPMEAAVEPPPIPAEYAERRFTTPGLRTEAVDPGITEGLARQAKVQGTVADVLGEQVRAEAADKAASAFPVEPQGPEVETAVEKAMRRTGQPLRTSAEIAAEGPVALRSQLEGEPNALQEPSTGTILQRQPEETGTPGSERGGVEPGVQGQETPEARQGTEAQPTQAEVAPEIPEGAKATVRGRDTEGNPVELQNVDAKEYAEKFTKERDAYQKLIDCLG